MKLVELLARELKEWPERTVEYVQGEDGCWPLSFSGARFEGSTWILETWQTTGSRGDVLHIDMASDYKTAIVTRAQWQAEHDRQKGGEWKRHRAGRKQPVEDGVFVEYKLRGGVTGACPASKLAWSHMGDDTDVMQYRAISQPQAEEVPMIADGDNREYKGQFPCAPEGEPLNQLEWDIQFPSGVCSVQAKTEQMETPFKWRDEVTELNAYIEKYTRERDALIERLASEGFALIPPVVSVMSGFSALTIPLKDCLVGDIVEVVSLEGFVNSSVQIGDKMPITSVDIHDGTVQVACGTWGDEDNYKFIRRP